MKSLYIREGETELISVSSFCFRECSWALKFKMNNYCIMPFKFIYSLHFYAYSSKLTRLHWSQCKIQHYWFIFGEQSFSENNSLFCRFKILMKINTRKNLTILSAEFPSRAEGKRPYLCLKCYIFSFCCLKAFLATSKA